MIAQDHEIAVGNLHTISLSDIYDNKDHNANILYDNFDQNMIIRIIII